MKKRILAVILCVIMLLSLIPSSFSLALTLGDLDGDGALKAADARLALRASVGLETLTDEQFKAADADFDGAIKAADARLILRASVGLETLHIHAYEEKVTTAPTCTLDGVKTFTCECGDSYTEAVAKTGHTAVTDPAAEPTCTEKGKTQGSHCSACNAVLVAQQDIAATGHTVVTDKALAPTCTAKGKTEGSHCSVCDTVLVAQKDVAATGHTVVTDKAVAPTCTAKGKTEGSHCSVCNTVLVAQKDVAATGHTVVTDKAVAPTCTAKGKTEGSHCSACNTVFVAQKDVAATGHTVVTDKAVAPTCTTKGKTQGSHCSACNTVFVAQKDVAATGHSHTSEIIKAATCCATGTMKYTCSCGNTYTEAIAKNNNHIKTQNKPRIEATCISVGYTEGVYCNDCKTYISGHEEIAKDSGNHINTESRAQVAATCIATGFTAGTYCNDCKTYTSGHEEIAKDSSNHINTKNVAKLDATCMTVGYTEGVYCNDCKTYTSGHGEIAIDPTAHKLDAGTVTIEATCTTAGTLLRTCQLNPEHTKEETIPVDANAHKFTYEITLPTCTENGYTTRECELCEYTDTVDETPATGHGSSTLDKTSVKAATCDTDGFTGNEKCDICGEITKAGEAIEKLGGEHDYVNITVDPSCTAGGYTVDECTKCNHRDYTTMLDNDETAVGHKWGTEKITKPTCTEEGYTEKVCTVEDCGAVEKYDIVPAAGHKEKVWKTTPATCIKEGKRTSTCRTCNAPMEEILPISACNPDNYVITAVPATADTPCLKVTACSLCHKEASVIEECELEPAKDEDGMTIFVSEFSCTTHQIALMECVNCHKTQEKVTRAARGHQAAFASKIDATCEEDGKITYSANCIFCGDNSLAGKTVTIPATGHKAEGTPTCVKDVVCENENCNHIVHKALGHSFVTRASAYNKDVPAFFCTRCGTENTDKLATFNTVANLIKAEKSPFRTTKVTSFGVEKTQTSYTKFDFGMYTSFIRDMYEEEIANTPDTYKAVDKQFVSTYLPLTSNGNTNVSFLENSDIDSIRFEKLNSLDFRNVLSGFSDEFTAKKYGKQNIYNITSIKDVRVNENIIKVTIDVRNETYYRDIRDAGLSDKDLTSLQKIYNFDIRSQSNEFDTDSNGKLYMTDSDSGDGYSMEMTMTVNELSTDARVTYYFLESTYEPVMVIYDIYQTMDQSIDMKFKMGVTIRGEMTPVIKTQNTVVYIFEKFTPAS